MTPKPGVPQHRPRTGACAGWALAVLGGMAAVVAAVLDPGSARSAASQAWSPFVLVAGLLLIGLVADEDRLFSAAGHGLARLARNGGVTFAGAMVLVGDGDRRAEPGHVGRVPHPGAHLHGTQPG
jgi:Na+/H+ antiporter NhaD/arsenite permease-like protein